MKHVVVVGGGIAGVSAAWAFQNRARVTLLAPNGIGDGASGVAAGLLNPFMGRKANPTWRWADAMEATTDLLRLAGEPESATGLLRPASSPKQAQAFARQAERFPDDLEWLSAPAPGTLRVRRGQAVDVAEMLQRAVAAMPEVAVLPDRLLGWHEQAESVQIETDSGDLSADALVVAAGAGWLANASDHVLHGVKGQIALLDAPDTVPTPISGGVYLAQNGPHVIVGSTFEHDFDDLTVDDAAFIDLRAKAARLAPVLQHAPIAGGRAGIRVTTPRSRLPLVGPVTPLRRVWCLTGLGAKGLLMGPMVARMLADALIDDQALPAEIDSAHRLSLPSAYAWQPLPGRLS